MKRVGFATIFLSAVLLVLLHLPAFSWICNDATVTNEVFCSFGPFEINMSSVSLSPATTVYDYSVDSLIADFSHELTTATLSDGSPIECAFGYFNFSDFRGEVVPQLISWAHAPCFVNVPAIGNVVFKVYHTNTQRSTITAGYPKVTYWKDGSADMATLSLDRGGSDGTGDLYRKEVSLACGVYWYQYTLKTLQFNNEYTLSISSFVVCNAPGGFTNCGTVDQAITTNGKVCLKWNMDDPAGTQMTYKVFVGKSADALQLVYSGTDPVYELPALEYDTEYYWQVEGTNVYGVSSRSPVNRFTTIQKVSKSFNYPNPFNPADGATTNIVFDMPRSGNVELSLFSELGDLCWRRSYAGFTAGNNEITYNGSDDNGNVLYNGTYVCVIRKNYDDGSFDTENCRLLIIK